MKFIVHRITGTDSGSDVFVSTNCQDDYDDIRFTNSSNQVLDYWIESSDSSSATIWVEADSLASGNITLYLYYGNASETTAVSNGENTFDLFDDFEGSSLDTDKWSASIQGSGGGYSIGSSVLRVDSGSSTNDRVMISAKSSFGTNTIVEMRLRCDEYSGTVGSWGLNNGGNPTYYFKVQSNQYNAEAITSSNSLTPLGTGYTGWHTWKIIRNGSTNIKFYIDNSLKKTESTYISTSSMPVRIMAYYNYNTIYSDWVLVRKYTATEPTIPSWGEEESL
ncbi:MAG: DUF2341 domain-containing protein [Candidatus Pacebacteria bacterium]|nr:DUF2341 domain-containing protein [Candidatus Paceibacterota bacterium]